MNIVVELLKRKSKPKGPALIFFCNYEEVITWLKQK